MRRFRFLRNPSATDIGNNVEEFLRFLGGAGCIFLDRPRWFVPGRQLGHDVPGRHHIRRRRRPDRRRHLDSL